MKTKQRKREQETIKERNIKNTCEKIIGICKKKTPREDRKVEKERLYSKIKMRILVDKTNGITRDKTKKTINKPAYNFMKKKIKQTTHPEEKNLRLGKIGFEPMYLMKNLSYNQAQLTTLSLS